MSRTKGKTPQLLLGDSRLGNIVAVCLSLYGIGIVGLGAIGKLTLPLAGVALAAPVGAFLAALRPGWLILFLVAVPSAFLSLAPIRAMTLLLILPLVAQLLLRGRLYPLSAIVLLPLIAIVVATYVFQADVNGKPALAAEGFRKLFIYYLLLSVVAFNAVRLGELRVRSFVNSLLVGVVASVLIVLATHGFRIAALSAREGVDPGQFDLQSHLGYLVAMAFSVAFARALLPGIDGRAIRFGRLVFALGLLAVTLLCLIRGAWAVAMITLIYVPIKTRRHAYLFLVIAAAGIALSFPLFRERLLSDVAGGVGNAAASGELGSGRWGLWTILWHLTAPALPWGNGFGYMWTLSSEKLFGFAGNFGPDAFVYPHNDFLFWTLQFGVFGLGLVLTFWSTLYLAFRRVARRLRASAGDEPVWILGGIFMTMLVAEVVDNGIFMRAVAERFFMAAGVIFAMASRPLETIGSPEGNLSDEPSEDEKGPVALMHT